VLGRETERELEMPARATRAAPPVREQTSREQVPQTDRLQEDSLAPASPVQAWRVRAQQVALRRAAKPELDLEQRGPPERMDLTQVQWRAR
jgi:hypothetical protein